MDNNMPTIPVPSGPSCELCEHRSAKPGSDVCQLCFDILAEQSICGCELLATVVTTSHGAEVRVVHELGCFYRSKSGVPLLPKLTSARRSLPLPPP